MIKIELKLVLKWLHLRTCHSYLLLLFPNENTCTYVPFYFIGGKGFNAFRPEGHPLHRWGALIISMYYCLLILSSVFIAAAAAAAAAVCVCLYTCMYVRMHLCIYLWMYLSLCSLLHVCLHACLAAFVFVSFCQSVCLCCVRSIRMRFLSLDDMSLLWLISSAAIYDSTFCHVTLIGRISARWNCTAVHYSAPNVSLELMTPSMLIYTALHYWNCRYTTSLYTALHCTALHCTALHYTTVTHTALTDFTSHTIAVHPPAVPRDRAFSANGRWWRCTLSTR